MLARYSVAVTEASSKKTLGAFFFSVGPCVGAGVGLFIAAILTRSGKGGNQRRSQRLAEDAGEFYASPPVCGKRVTRARRS